MVTSGNWCGWIRTPRHRRPDVGFDATRARQTDMHSATYRAIAAVWRIESAKIVASVARLVRDIGVAEELAQDALVAALEHWPKEGVPDKPAAWLVTTAKHRALDRQRP